MSATHYIDGLQVTIFSWEGCLFLGANKCPLARGLGVCSLFHCLHPRHNHTCWLARNYLHVICARHNKEKKKWFHHRHDQASFNLLSSFVCLFSCFWFDDFSKLSRGVQIAGMLWVGT